MGTCSTFLFTNYGDGKCMTKEKMEWEARAKAQISLSLLSLLPPLSVDGWSNK